MITVIVRIDDVCDRLVRKTRDDVTDMMPDVDGETCIDEDHTIIANDYCAVSHVTMIVCVG